MRDIDSSHTYWSGAAADAARDNGDRIAAAGDGAARQLVVAAVAARDAADQIAAAQAAVQAGVANAHDGGFEVADDGTVSIRTDPPQLLVALSGGRAAVAHDMLVMRADELTRQLTAALDALGTADADAAADIEEAFTPTPNPQPAATVPAGAWPAQASDMVAGWPAISQDRIGEQ